MPDDSDARDKLYRFTVNRIEYYPKRFSERPARVTGKLQVNTWPTVERRWIDPDIVPQQLPEGAELNGNAYFTAPATTNYQPTVYAKDISGHFLKEMATIRYGYDDSPTRQAHYFFGTPKQMLLCRAGDAKQLIYAFDVKLED